LNDLQAKELLDHCVASRTWPSHLLDDLLAGDGDAALFRIVVEGLADLFEPHLCHVYAELFSRVIARGIPGMSPDELTARYERVRQPRAFDRNPDSIDNVFVLSRVTLGADVAVTSVVLDGVKQGFPNATIWFVGPAKNWELFAADTRLRHRPIVYPRGGTIDDRLSAWPRLRESVRCPRSIVVDPDSRLTQLGLLPICPDEDYFFFESRSYGTTGSEPLSVLASRWVAETFGVSSARAYIRTGLEAEEFAATLSLGVGGNASKRVRDPFEAELLRRLPRPVLIDKGGNREEAERVERAVAQTGGDGIVLWDGSFAGFAERIRRSRLYAGYDSAGGHVAAACGTPLICIFAGAVCERMYRRWSPTGPGSARTVRPPETALDDTGFQRLLATVEESIRQTVASYVPAERGSAACL
jgi:hypothetical protein